MKQSKGGKQGACGAFLHIFVFVKFCFATDLQIPLKAEPEETHHFSELLCVCSPPSRSKADDTPALTVPA